MCVYLGEALTAAQVRALLPGPGPALVVTTSRRIVWAPEDNAQVINAGAD